MLHTIRTRIENRVATIAANLANIRHGATVVKFAVWVGVALIYSHFVINFGFNLHGMPSRDLPSFYTASVATFKLHQSPYSLASLNQLADQQVFSYVYPPPSLLFFYPFSLVSFPQAQLLMLVLNHGFVLLSAYLLMQVLPISVYTNPVKVGLLCGYILLLTPINTTIQYGQIGLVLLVLLLAFWRLAQQHRPVLAGALLALAVVLKVYPVLLLPLLLIVRRYRETAATLVWIALISVAAGIILPAALWSDWFFNVVPMGGYGHVPPDLFSPALPWNLSIHGFFARLFTDSLWTQGMFTHVNGMQTATLCTYITAGILITISLVALAKHRTRSLESRLHHVMMVGLPLIFLVAPLSWIHHTVHLIPAVLALMITQPRILTRYTLLYRLSVGVIAVILISRQASLYLPAVLFIWLLHIGLVLQPEVSFPSLSHAPKKPQRPPKSSMNAVVSRIAVASAAPNSRSPIPDSQFPTPDS